MIYLQSEVVEFKKTSAAFEGAFRLILEEMFRTFKKKGEVRDVETPIHHRQAPKEQLGVARAKCRRIESLTSVPGWERDPKALALVIEECCDAANYLTFIAALSSMLLDEGKPQRIRTGTGGSG